MRIKETLRLSFTRNHEKKNKQIDLFAAESHLNSQLKADWLAGRQAYHKAEKPDDLFDLRQQNVECFPSVGRAR